MSLHLVVEEIRQETPAIRSYVLRNCQQGLLPKFSPGAHVKITLNKELIRQYSLCNDPEQQDLYTIAVLREPDSTGGSSWMHDNVVLGTQLEISKPVNQFPLDSNATCHILVAGGIGITPILSMAKFLHRTDQNFELYYCTRSIEDTAFYNEIKEAPFSDKVTIIHDGGDPVQGLNMEKLLAEQGGGEHVYICGPQGLISAAREASAHWCAGSVHFELFSADQEVELHTEIDTEFRIRVDSTGLEYVVPAGSSALQVLAENGIEVEHLCKEGYCGSCLTGVIEGTPDHRDSVQTESEKADNDFMTLCCSRSKSDLIVLDL